MRISWMVAICFLIMVLAVALSSTLIVFVEPGIERIVAGLVAVFAFVLLIFGVVEPGKRVFAVRKYLARMSEGRLRSGLSASAMIAIAILALEFGPHRFYQVTVACADAKTITRPKLFKSQIESCGPDSRVSFTTWHISGGDDLRKAILCNYSVGDQALLVESQVLHCPVHSFSYQYGFNNTVMLWSRTIDGHWIERNKDTSHGDLVSTYSEVAMTAPGADGVIVRRNNDGGNMEILIPDVFAGNRMMYVRDTPKHSWRAIGSIITP